MSSADGVSGRSQCNQKALLWLKNCPFSCSKSLSLKGSSTVIATATCYSYWWEGKDSSWLPLFEKSTWYKKLWTLLVFLPRSWWERELLPPQRNRRSVILGRLCFKGDPYTVPGGSCDEMSHQIRNTILKFSLFWLYSSTESIPEKNLSFRIIFILLWMPFTYSKWKRTFMLWLEKVAQRTF